MGHLLRCLGDPARYRPRRDRPHAVCRIRSCPRLHTDEREKERLALSAEIEAILAADVESLGLFRAALVSAATFVPGRERSKTSIIRVVGEMRLALWELGRRAVVRGEMSQPSDVCMLFSDELEALVAGSLDGVADLVAGRHAHQEWLKSLEPPFIINGRPAPTTDWPQRGASPIVPVEVDGARGTVTILG